MSLRSCSSIKQRAGRVLSVAIAVGVTESPFKAIGPNSAVAGFVETAFRFR
jgi:hypothetical protein